MKSFDEFKEYLNKNGAGIDDNMLSALEVYHKWLQSEALKIDGKEVCEAIRREAQRMGENPLYLM